MLKNRLFNVLMIVALVAIVVVTISQAVATIRVVSAAPASRDTVSAGADQLLAADQCAILAGGRQSLRAVYVKQMGIWLPRTGSGFTGLDGGLLALLSQSRECSIAKDQ